MSADLEYTWTKKSTGGYAAPGNEDGILALDTGGKVTLTEGRGACRGRGGSAGW
ncbi:hypothetical protein [Amycolatopsis sp. H20-H5]|uniref:hypothetical protein n=1 Tax=Amycolatopsis sp. H20-H5 TaxID=3046309 RepID=UPI002DB9B7B1|nr:hypothetical protein [Amycolatopsis sp. H20-H5]MEC3981803.1 hypothetical protein [Amycolatopsis sp. H20-H5]